MRAADVMNRRRIRGEKMGMKGRIEGKKRRSSKKIGKVNRV